MTWEQKFEAMVALVGWSNLSLKMRAPGDWYVSAVGREVVDDGVLLSKYGNGATPAQAIEDDWKKIAESGAVIRLDGPGGKTNKRWNGYMWADVTVTR